MEFNPSFLPIRGIMINAHPNDYQNLPVYFGNELTLVDITTKRPLIPLKVRIEKQRGSVIYLRDIIVGMNTMYNGYRFSMRMVGGAPRIGENVYGIQRVVGRELAPKNVMSSWSD